MMPDDEYMSRLGYELLGWLDEPQTGEELAPTYTQNQLLTASDLNLEMGESTTIYPFWKFNFLGIYHSNSN